MRQCAYYGQKRGKVVMDCLFEQKTCQRGVVNQKNRKKGVVNQKNDNFWEFIGKNRAKVILQDPLLKFYVSC